MKYTVTWLPRYQTKIPGKYENWNNLKSISIAPQIHVNLKDWNYSITYK